MTESYTVGGDAYYQLDEPCLNAQVFKPSASHFLNFVDLNLKVGIFTAPVFVAIFEGIPPGIDLNSPLAVSKVDPPLVLPGSTVRTRFPIKAAPLLSEGVYYTIVAYQGKILAGTRASVLYDSVLATYPRGWRAWSNNDGASWLTDYGQDTIFTEFGNPPLPKPEPAPTVTNFATLALDKAHFATSIFFRLTTSTPCHLSLYWTDIKPLKHQLTRVVRGLAVPWRTYFCFVGWHQVDQLEVGDTTYHTFIVSPWLPGETKWYTFRGEVDEVISPSVGPIFEHTHPGLTTREVTIPISHDYDDFRRLDGAFQSCPTVCPPLLSAGYFNPGRLHAGCGLRFRDNPLPWLADIKESNLTFTCFQTINIPCPYTRLSAEQASNPPDFSQETAGSAEDRWKNSGYTRNWDNIPTWFLNTEYQSPDITPIIQALVNRAFWYPGNAMVLFWNDWDERTPRDWFYPRRAFSHNVAPDKAVRLYCKYTS